MGNGNLKRRNRKTEDLRLHNWKTDDQHTARLKRQTGFTLLRHFAFRISHFAFRIMHFAFSIFHFRFPYLRFLFPIYCFLSIACNKNDKPAPAPPAGPFNFSYASVDGARGSYKFNNASLQPVISIAFSSPVHSLNAASRIRFTDKNNNPIPFSVSFANNDSIVRVTPNASLSYLTKYTIAVSSELQSSAFVRLNSALNINLLTKLDSSYKFPVVSDEQLLNIIQRQHFKYFWEFGHPVSGLARERNNSGDVVTSGGSGFGVMAIIAAIHRNFITRQEGLDRIAKIVSFLKTNAQHVHGAYPHWLNGATGAIVPFSEKDNGADLVETSYLFMGLITARQYFSELTPQETSLRNDIQFLYDRVEWDFFRKNNENVLYWHFSNNYQWEMNLPIRGWNETLITYVMAASSTTHSIPKEVYQNGFAQNGAIQNNNSYYGIHLPLGPSFGGPLFFAHYSFLGIDPRGLKDAYADYFEQNKNHSLIHYEYSRQNPRKYFGYSDSVWGLTASDDPFVGYKAHEPSKDNGVVSPTAALSSFPYTPEESMKALKFSYYVLGDKLFKEYGFVDAFSLDEPWFANTFLAIDQGPIIIMIENHRSGLLWDLFMSAPEVKTGLTKLGFESPKL